MRNTTLQLEQILSSFEGLLSLQFYAQSINQALRESNTKKAKRLARQAFKALRSKTQELYVFLYGVKPAIGDIQGDELEIKDWTIFDFAINQAYDQAGIAIKKIVHYLGWAEPSQIEETTKETLDTLYRLAWYCYDLAKPVART